ncbi:phospho-N-acetylmuramoyl-pentapeptide-transferase [Aminithiophilus ramosus]|uniref:Phospho-N-acetylmuramoyl-pentapeptide-transferase n=3 Tax=Synergistales TaxID=649776 RepID=A0A9Q7EYP1_9BACT|nr:phospho-N-acetylmuramoyl-pentapeptide-transferase [Aminithiophilus ramosus]QVL37610.1 phospho-N-acetylmuramoyl-pentapeptide-transferase [Synergistota bacterium]
MIIRLIFASLLTFCAAVFLQGYWIRCLLRLNVSQTLKAYGPQRHLETKKGTPTMGGIVFPFAFFIGLVLARPIIDLTDSELFLVLFFPTAMAIIGLVDDGMKFMRHSSEGLSSLQKLTLQIFFCFPWALLVSFGEGLSLWPGQVFSAGISVPILLFMSVGVLNAVNITDGLDGLASGAFSISMIAGAFFFKTPWMVLSVIAAAVSLAFMWHNGHPAKIFMGDVGAHFLGGLLIVLCVRSQWTIALFPLGFIFGIEAISVVIQLFSIWVRKKKIFLMSPIHHHFELLGWNETEIVLRFWLLHLLGMVFLLGLILMIIA